VGAFGGLSDLALRSFELFAEESDDLDADADADGMDTATSAALSAEARAAASAAQRERRAKARADEMYVYVDAHVLATPALADVDGDGVPEIILSVSYYFDVDESSDSDNADELRKRLPVGIDPHHFVAGGVVVFSLPRPSTSPAAPASPATAAEGTDSTGFKKAGDSKKARNVSNSAWGLFAPLRGGLPLWSEQLDLTTDESMLRAHIYAAPTVADLEADGSLEIVVGTSMGFVYVLNARTGKTKQGWPVQLAAEIQGQVVAEDISEDSSLELVAADAHGHVIALRADGTELWAKRVAGLAAHGVATGDINSDGQVDVVVATTAGAVHALDGETGEELSGFPVRTAEKIVSLPLLLRLNEPRVGNGGRGSGGRSGAAFGQGGLTPDGGPAMGLGVHVVVPAFDGRLYVISGASGCTHTLDLGERSYAQPISADLSGSGKLDLVISTMTGSLIALETETFAHPLRARSAVSSAALNRPGALLEGGFSAHLGARDGHTPREVTGKTFDVTVYISDPASKRAVVEQQQPGRYHVSLSLAGAEVSRFNVTVPGAHVVHGLKALAARSRAPLRLRVTNAHAQVVEDSLILTFNSAFYRAIKWLVAIPALALGAVALLPDRRGEMSGRAGGGAGGGGSSMLPGL